MVVTGIFSVSLADGTEEPRTCTTESGITLTVPKGYQNILWPGIDENDPLLSHLGIDKSQAMDMYKLGGTEFQCSKRINDDVVIFAIIFEKNTPSDLNADFSEIVQTMIPGSFGTTEAFGYGMVKKPESHFTRSLFRLQESPEDPEIRS